MGERNLYLKLTGYYKEEEEKKRKMENTGKDTTEIKKKQEKEYVFNWKKDVLN